MSVQRNIAVILSVVIVVALLPGLAAAQQKSPMADFLEKIESGTAFEGDGSQQGGGAALPADDTSPRNSGLSLKALSGGQSLSSNEGSNWGNLNRPTAEQSREEIERTVREQAFKAAITGMLPLKPDEIRTVLEKFDETRQAVEVPIYPYPEPEIVVDTVSLDPGAKPAVIKVAMGHVTTVSILDVTGEPWPIEDMSWGGDFEIIQPEEGGNIFRITPTSDFTYGNMSIRLLELRTPVTFTLKTERDKVYYRYDARIPELGPMAETQLIEGSVSTLLVSGANPFLGAVLDGVAPSEAEKLNVTGADSRTTAYKVGDVTYVRTPLTLLSPGWTSSVSSADGMNVYTVSNAPVLLLSDKGSVVRAHLASKDEMVDD